MTRLACARTWLPTLTITVSRLLAVAAEALVNRIPTLRGAAGPRALELVGEVLVTRTRNGLRGSEEVGKLVVTMDAVEAVQVLQPVLAEEA